MAGSLSDHQQVDDKRVSAFAGHVECLGHSQGPLSRGSELGAQHSGPVRVTEASQTSQALHWSPRRGLTPGLLAEAPTAPRRHRGVQLSRRGQSPAPSEGTATMPFKPRPDGLVARAIDPRGAGLTAYSVQIGPMQDGQPMADEASSLSDNQHHDPERLAATGVAGVRERYRAAAALVCRIMIETIATLRLVQLLASHDLLPVPPAARVAEVIVTDRDGRARRGLPCQVRRRHASATDPRVGYRGGMDASAATDRSIHSRPDTGRAPPTSTSSTWPALASLVRARSSAADEGPAPDDRVRCPANQGSAGRVPSTVRSPGMSSLADPDAGGWSEVAIPPGRRAPRRSGGCRTRFPPGRRA
jgi:hypothetical protein